MSGASALAERLELRRRMIEPASSRIWRRLRFIPLGIGAAALLFGLWTGLARLGLMLPGGTPALAEFHGALMISGFLGTLISLERAVAIGRYWAYGAPALSALGALALFAGAPSFAALPSCSRAWRLRSIRLPLWRANPPSLPSCWPSRRHAGELERSNGSWAVAWPTSRDGGWSSSFSPLRLNVSSSAGCWRRRASARQCSRLLHRSSSRRGSRRICRGAGALQRLRAPRRDRLAREPRYCGSYHPPVRTSALFGGLHARRLFLAGRGGLAAHPHAARFDRLFI